MKATAKKILIVTDYFYPHWTGISKSMYFLAKSLSGVYEVSILTVRFDNSLPKQEVIENAQITRSEYLFTISRSRYSLSMLFDFLRLVKGKDIIFINAPFSNILPITVLAKILRKKIYIFHQGDLILPAGFKNRLIEKIFDISCFLSMIMSTKISTYTQEYAEHSRILTPFLKKVYPLLLPIYTQKKKTTKLNKRGKKIIIGFAGRFVEEKGFDILFRAIPHLVKRYPGITFIYAGQKDLPYENFFAKNYFLYKKVEKNIKILGLLTNAELEKFYSSLDILVAPSRSDCFNLVQAEAALFGVPLVVSDIPGLSYLVKKTGFGYTAKCEDPKDLAQKIEKAIENRVLLRQNHDKVLALLDNQKNVKEIKKFIER